MEEEIEFKCPQCGKECSSPAGLNSHQRNKHNKIIVEGKKGLCPYCKEYFSVPGLYIHIPKCKERTKGAIETNIEERLQFLQLFYGISTEKDLVNFLITKKFRKKIQDLKTFSKNIIKGMKNVDYKITRWKKEGSISENEIDHIINHINNFVLKCKEWGTPIYFRDEEERIFTKASDKIEQAKKTMEENNNNEKTNKQQTELTPEIEEEIYNLLDEDQNMVPTDLYEKYPEIEMKKIYRIYHRWEKEIKRNKKK